MKNRGNIVFYAGVILLMCCAASASAQSIPEDPPNILVILTDDMGYGDISALNPESKIQTPNLDRLVGEGMHFTEAHTSAAICTPTRYALMTGRYSFRTGLDGVATGCSEPLIESERETVASLLKKAEYSTAIIGKWHLGLDWQREDPARPLFTRDAFIPESLNVDYSKPAGGVNEVGFDYSYISPGGNNIAPFTFVEDGQVVQEPADFIAPLVQGHTFETRRNGGDIALEYKLDRTLSRLTDKAVCYLRSQEGSSKPFFLYFPLTAPHFPWKPAGEFKGTSKAGAYGDFVQEIDYRVGELLQAIEDHQFDENTLVIFTADNGGAFEPWFVAKTGHDMNQGRKGQKHHIWEGGVRVPFIARWKGVVEAGSVADEPISLVDMLATFSALTGQAPNPDDAEDSRDISPILLGEAGAVRRGAMINQAGGARELSITKGRWKLIPYGHGDSGLEPSEPGEPKGMLFNLEDDPMEERNVYDQYPERVSALLERYKKHGYSSNYAMFPQ